MPSLLKPQVITLFLLVIATTVPGLAQDKLTVYTVNYPLAYFAERIGGEHVAVNFPAPPDLNPALWSPDQATIHQYQQADLIILNGAGYAKWTQKVSLPMLRTVDTSRSLRAQLIEEKGSATHSHGPEGEHSHGGTVSTTWLDFSQAAIQARAIYRAMVRRVPKQAAEFRANHKELLRDLELLDTQMLEIGNKLHGQPLFGSHPIYQYLARRYNLNMKMVLWEPDIDPGEPAWFEFQRSTKKHQAEWMIWEDEPLQASIDRLAKMGIGSLVFSPCFNRPEKEDFLAVMKQNIENLRVAYEL